ncbi:helix-turn-helix domain-containing protein [Nocardia brevicatena]|uniref:helix-turn-helix domain-containing protein n=1 Tax=Nocardia brevicatena TaxID=37327 RepID=UPI0005924E8F|nr:helix-turn-helix transcriptional regulator [Nocardia brevicatena]
MSETNSTLPRRQLGRYLREARESIGLTLVEAARLMEWSKSALQRLEKGQTERIRTHNIVLLGEIYQLEREEIEDLKALAEQAAVKSWWHEYGSFISPSFDVYMGLESSAREITLFQSSVIPGIVQTADYSRTLDRLFFPHDTDEQLAKRIELRRRRQSVILRRTRPATVMMTLHESTLRTVVGSPKVMAAQLRHIADLSTQPNVELRVLGFRAGLPLGTPTGPFAILDFGSASRAHSDEPTVVYAEAFTGAMYFEKEADVSRYREGYEVLRGVALDVRPTRDLLRGVAREYERER